MRRRACHFIAIRKSTKDQVKPEVQAHYADAIAEVRALGFTEEFYISDKDLQSVRYDSEKITLWQLQSYQRRFPYTPLLLHQHDYAYATIVGEWVTFGTIFKNESVIQTTSVACVARFYPAVRSNPDENYFLHVAQSQMAADIWELHQRCVKNMGRSVLPLLSLIDALKLQYRINDIQFGNTPALWNDDEADKKKTLSFWQTLLTFVSK